MSTALIKRATIDEIVGYRNLAIEKFQVAVDAIDEALKIAAKAAGGNAFYVDSNEAKRAFDSYDRNHEKFLGYMRKQTDRAIWSHLISGYGFDKLMDRQSHEEFRAQLDKDPPEVSIETAEGTIATLVMDADKIFRRGIANAFAKLDRRFRSHDGFKIGDRVVLSYAFDNFGSWNHHARHEDTIRDIERTFVQLDGKEMPEDRYAGIIGVIDTEKRNHRSLERSAWQVENDYFRVKAFKNGNCHLWFKRDDLLRKVNKLLAEHYGEVLGAGADAVEDDPLGEQHYKTTLAKNMGWFPTPAAVAHRLIERAEIGYASSYTGPVARILEPSAGEGAIALAARERCERAEIVCVEMHAERATKLRDLGFETHQRDWLTTQPAMIGQFDRILMNPPFDMGRDIDHVAHAVRFLKPGGKIVAIMSARVEFAEDKKSVAFRKLVERMDGSIFDLPAGSFEESGTMVNTCVVILSAKRA